MSLSFRAQVITRRTYNRPTNEEGTTFETWAQTISRCIGHQKWLWERALGRSLSTRQNMELLELHDLLLERKVGLSGRTLWLGGTDIAKTRELSQFNCFGEETSFISSTGVRKFSECRDGETVQVLDHQGVWKQAVVRSYGQQALQVVTLAKGNSSQPLRATANHEWVLADGSRTRNLKVGDRLHRPAAPMNSWDFDNADPFEQLYWCYGFVFGDGTLNNGGTTSMARLCGKKAQYVSRFQKLGFRTSQPLSCGGDPFAYTGTYQKRLPELAQDGVAVVRGFVRGLLDADGAAAPNRVRSASANLFATIQVTGSETIEWVRRTFPAVGVYITSERQVPGDTNFGERSGETISFGVTTSFGESSNSTYSVSSITADATETVWCLEVEDSHSFTLPNGVTTGNCSFTSIRTVSDVVDAMWLLLNGSGVGFWPKPGQLNGFQTPLVVQYNRSSRTLEQWAAGERGAEHNLETFEDGVWTIRVGDSAAAWAKAIGKVLAGKYGAHTLVIDTTQVRPAGLRLRGYGWISSGDGTMSAAMGRIAQIMSGRAGELLSFSDIHDIMNHCGTVLSTRRSAQIALCEYGSPEWEKFSGFKSGMYESGNAHREQSNNSLVFYKKPLLSELQDIFGKMLAAGGSEPGFVNGAAAKSRAPWFEGMNPCFAEDTLITTDKGAFKIKDLVGETVNIWDGQAWVEIDNFRVTGENQEMLSIEMHDGSVLRVTPAHKMVLADGTKTEARNLTVGTSLMVNEVQYDGDISVPGAYLKGFLLGDGTNTDHPRPVLYLYAPKYVCMDRLVESALEIAPGEVNTNAVTVVGFGNEYDGKRRQMAGIGCRKDLRPWCGSHKKSMPDEVFQWDRKSKLDLIAGLFDADGTASDTSNGFMYQVSSVEREFLMQLQMLLKSVGVPSTLGKMSGASMKEMPGGEYFCRDSYRLTISQRGAVALARQVKFERLVSFADKPLKYNVRSKAGIVRAISEDGVDSKVYCCTVPITHTVLTATGVLTGQCGEILLADKGFCNLVNMNLGAFKTMNSLLRAIWLIARANYRQTCVDLRDGLLQESWHQNNLYLRLCGVSLTGQAMRPDLTAYDYRVLKNEAIAGAYAMAAELGTPRPKNVTTGKPEGTLSKCMDATEGAHTPLARYILNNVAFSGHDPLVEILRRANYDVIPHPSRPGDVYIPLPVAWDSVKFTKVGDLEVNLDSAVKQLTHYKLMMDNFVEQNQSITVSYSPEEVPEIIEWLLANWDHYVGVSFLLRADPLKTAEDLGYAYLPQQPVTKAVYDAYVSKLLPVNLDEDTGDALMQIDDCSTGACPIR